MKKLIMTPTKDSITICLPEDWVGKRISCILDTEESEEQKMEAKEPDPNYNVGESAFEETWRSQLEDELWKNI